MRRSQILQQCTHATFGAVLLDALTAHRASQGVVLGRDQVPADFVKDDPELDDEARASQRSAMMASQFRLAYARAREVKGQPNFSDDEALALLKAHSSVFKPLLERLVARALEILSTFTQAKEPSKMPLSAVEEERWLRAMYQYQLVCNLYGCREDENGWRGIVSYESARFTWLTVTAWEADAIMSIHTLAMYTVSRCPTLMARHDDWRSLGPTEEGDCCRFPSRFPSTSRREWEGCHLVVGLTSMGLPLLHRRLDLAELSKELERNLYRQRYNTEGFLIDTGWDSMEDYDGA